MTEPQQYETPPADDRNPVPASTSSTRLRRPLLFAGVGALLVAVVVLAILNGVNLNHVSQWQAANAALQQRPPVTQTVKTPVTVVFTSVQHVTEQADPVTVQADPVTVQADPVTVQPDPVTETVTAQAAAPAQAAASSFPDGSYLIGSEMPAGNYTASGATDTCVWLIFDSAHNPTDSGVGRIATVPSSGYSFQSSDCGTWSPAN